MIRLHRALVVRVRAVINHLRPASPPQDPLAAVREPRWRRPGGRSSSVAVPEPGDEVVTDAIGASGDRPRW